MADKKVSQLTALTSPNDEDLLLIVDDPNGTPVSKSITVKTLLGALPSNTSITGSLTVSANGSFTGSNVNFTSNVVVTGTTTMSQIVGATNRITIKKVKHQEQITQQPSLDLLPLIDPMMVLSSGIQTISICVHQIQ